MKEALKLALEALNHYEKAGLATVKTIDAITAINKALAQPEFVTHTVEQPDNWSEWVCPDTTGYLMKCCDCGLVHEAQFKVVRYKSEDEREECDPVNDPNLQAVFRMRRSEEWTPKDTAYRPGGLAQPEQEPVAFICQGNAYMADDVDEYCTAEHTPLYTTPPQRTWVGLTDEERKETLQSVNTGFVVDAGVVAQAIEAKLKEKNT